LTLRHPPAGLLPLVLILVASPAAAQSGSRFGVEVSADGTALVHAPGLAEDEGLRGALESGLPLRFRLRVELWRKALFDQLSGTEEVNVALVYDPLDRVYLLDDGREESRHASFPAARTAVERALGLSLRPRRSGRYYYLATLQVETLSLSDLDELRRWLRGEVQPAVEGRRSPTRAVESGLRRMLVRVMGLPSRSYEDRSATFIVPR
jgi:hypothetical protein